MAVEAFSARLRDEVALDALAAERLAVADHTMQPTMAWCGIDPHPSQWSAPAPEELGPEDPDTQR